MFFLYNLRKSHHFFKEFFTLPRAFPEWRLIETGIEQEFQDRYKDRKGRKKRHFDEHEGMMISRQTEKSTGGHGQQELAEVG